MLADVDSDDPAVRDLVVRFQQVCGPAMAKGVEDTTFYRYHRLIALNEVGGDPGALETPGPRPAARLGGVPAGAPPARHDDALDARHQAQRGRPSPAARPRR